MTTLPTAPFWMVYGVGAGRPTYQHDTQASAEQEAKRLARDNPGNVFVVLEAIGAVMKDDLKTVRFTRAGPRGLTDDDIPF